MIDTQDMFPAAPVVEPTHRKANKRKPLLDIPDDLSPEDKARVRVFVLKKYPQWCHSKPGGMRDIVQDCLDWHRSEGRKRRDWALTVQRWCRKKAEFEYSNAVKTKAEKPQYDTRSRGSEMTGLNDLVSEFQESKDPRAE